MRGIVITAPRSPQCPIGGLEFPRQAGGVAQRRGSEARPEHGAQLRQSVEVRRSGHGTRDIGIDVLRDPVIEAYRVQDSGAKSSDGGAAGQ